MRNSLIYTLIYLAIATTSQAENSLHVTRLGMKAPIVPMQQVAGVRHYRHASTVGQSYLDGMANLTLARGQAMYFRSLAHLTMTQAHQNRIANDVTRVKTYFAKREARQDYRRKKEQSQQLRRERNQTRRNQAAAPEITLDWPVVMSTDAYAKQRQEIEALVRMRNRMQGEYAESAQRVVRKAVASLAEQVKADELDGKLTKLDSKIARSYLFKIYNGGGRPTSPSVQLLATK